MPTNSQGPAPLLVPPPTMPPPFLPFAHLPAIPVDEAGNGWGIAQQITRARKLQGRVLWIDATANLDRVNTAEKIAALVAQIKSTGFNTIVFEVKPIVGLTLYPSRFAPKLTQWNKPGFPARTLALPFDPLKVFVDETRRQTLSLIVNFNAFSEGHRDFQKGPGYEHPEWQTILYEEQARLRLGVEAAALSIRPDELPISETEVGVYTDVVKLRADLPKRGLTISVVTLVDGRGVVIGQVSGGAFAALGAGIPANGAALVGMGPRTADLLRRGALVGQTLTLESAPAYVPIGQRPRRQVPLMTNPFDPAVRQRVLDMVSEVVAGYAVDGVIFDDRLRYAGLDADFSPLARQQFEQYIGRSVRWPDEVLRFQYTFPRLERRTLPGPYYDAWLTFRALNLRNWLAQAVATAKAIRPGVSVGTYVGSWYPDYPDVGANWAADDFSAGFRFLNNSYQRTGWAGLVDFVTTGCYYPTATLVEANAKGLPIGESVEAAGQFSNRAVNEQTFVYAGIALSDFANKPDDLKRVLQAAAASTQGVMVFDLSHNIEPLWPVFADAFREPAQAPHTVPGLLADVRAQHAAKKAAGTPDPPVILYRGASGTGF